MRIVRFPQAPWEAGGVDEEVCTPRGRLKLRQDMWVGLHQPAEGEDIPGSRYGSHEGMEAGRHVAFQGRRLGSLGKTGCGDLEQQAELGVHGGATTSWRKNISSPPPPLFPTSCSGNSGFSLHSVSVNDF